MNEWKGKENKEKWKMKIRRNEERKAGQKKVRKGKIIDSE